MTSTAFLLVLTFSLCTNFFVLKKLAAVQDDIEELFDFISRRINPPKEDTAAILERRLEDMQKTRFASPLSYSTYKRISDEEK